MEDLKVIGFQSIGIKDDRTYTNIFFLNNDHVIEINSSDGLHIDNEKVKYILNPVIKDDYGSKTIEPYETNTEIVNEDEIKICKNLFHSLDGHSIHFGLEMDGCGYISREQLDTDLDDWSLEDEEYYSKNDD